MNDHWTWSAGIDAGWNTFDADDRANFLGGLTYTDKDWGSLAFAINTGDESIFGPGVGPFANRTMYSLVWSRTFNNCFTYVLQHDFGYQSLAPLDLLGREWYGINQYLLYKFNNCWSAGARIEWFRDDDGYRVTGLRPGNAIQGASFPGNFFEYTLGLNYKPNANLTMRPEVRWDNYHGLPNQNQGVPPRCRSTAARDRASSRTASICVPILSRFSSAVEGDSRRRCRRWCHRHRDTATTNSEPPAFGLFALLLLLSLITNTDGSFFLVFDRRITCDALLLPGTHRLIVGENRCKAIQRQAVRPLICRGLRHWL